VANFEHLGYAFEPTAGLYSGWGPGGIYEKIFSELRVNAPQVDRLSPSYTVRLPDGCEIIVAADRTQFTDSLWKAFPECAEGAATFYDLLDTVNSHPLESSAGEQVVAHLRNCSTRFRRFIDVQLQTLTQSAADQCLLGEAALALTTPLRGMWAIRGGAQALADSLAESIKKSGGSLRLNCPVLRLAYGTDGGPVGVDLLSGERLIATRAIVSNLTIWDTYGKLVGLSRAPAPISSQLRKLQAWGAYLLFLGMDQTASARLTSSRIMAVSDWHDGGAYSPEEAQLTFAAMPHALAPEGKVAVTISTFTHVNDWFSFHEDETAHEEQDQAMLESVWSRLHGAIPELGDSVEVIETATPRTFYENTRRKLGMIGRPSMSLQIPRAGAQPGQTIFPNVFLVSDTKCRGFGLAGVTEAAVDLASLLIKRT
jgi:phytoene dehydrogenase-like protein